jgi:hydroxyacylglutathione hydrolase
MKSLGLGISIILSIAFLPFSKEKAGEIRIQAINAGMSTAFAIESNDGLFLIDAGSPGQEKSILKQLKKFSDKPLRLIIITHAHFDHYGSAEKLREMTGARIAIHALDAQAMTQGKTYIPLTHSWGNWGKMIQPAVEAIVHTLPTSADLMLNDGDTLSQYGLPGRVIYVPGHTIGSIAILLDNGTAFISDLLATNPNPTAQSYYANDWNQLAASLKRMQSLNPSTVYIGHTKTTLTGERFQVFKPFIPK